MKATINRRTALKLLGAGATLAGSRTTFADAFHSPPKSRLERADVLVYGGTPAGIATVVRAARLGLNVVLVSYYRHIGGMPSNGLGLFDTLYNGVRAPLFNEYRSAIDAHYPQRNGTAGYEAHVAEHEFEQMLAREKRIKVLREFYPSEVNAHGRRITRVSFRHVNTVESVDVEASSFVDASYVGDLAKIAGAEMVAGREARDRYREPHAGVIYTRLEKTPITAEMKAMNLKPSLLMTSPPLPGSTGAGDNAVQAYNFRVCLSRDPQNQIPIQKPARYERDLYLSLKSRWKFTNSLPNLKTSWNAPLLIGGNFDYPDGSYATRKQIEERHKDLAMGLLWFLQNDPVVPEKTKSDAHQWGLPKDEFQDNGGFPWEVYVREARRLVGRYVFTERDAEIATGISRTPVFEDSIAFTEWSLDSHSCNTTIVDYSEPEGKLLLAEETLPAQLPYRCLLPKTVDNLLVTGTVSSTHVGWGTIRLEPTWMHLAESAAFAISLAHRKGISPAEIDSAELVRTLVTNGIMVSFFNDFDMSSPTLEQSAAQFLSTRGFFPGYNAKLNEPLSASVASAWMRKDLDATSRARLVAVAEAHANETITAAEFAAVAGREWKNPPQGPLSRGAACAWLFQIGA